MRKGDVIRRTPTVYSKFGRQTDMGVEGPQPCEVIYIHPKRRFFVVEFTASITGQTWRETVPIKRRTGG